MFGRGIKLEDIIARERIYKELGINPGQSKRSKNIEAYKKHLTFLKDELSEESSGEGLVDSNEKVKKRLRVLSSAYKAGHTNALQEMTLILQL